MDIETLEASAEVQKLLKDGAKFDELAPKYSDDLLTKDAKGVIGLISRTDTFLPPEFIEAAFELQNGEISGLVESRFGLHLIKINKVEGDEREVAHILFSYFDVDQFLRDELAKTEVVDYITVE